MAAMPIVAAAGAPPVVAAAGSGAGGRHAALHDFCMAIPYGALALVGGLIVLASGGGSLGGGLAAGGAIVCAMAAMSLRAWRAGTSSTPFTLIAAAIAATMLAAVNSTMKQGVASAVAKTAGWGFVALSAALSAFLIYNVGAGGNPPPSGK